MDNGALAQLARAPALQAGGHRFESDMLHQSVSIRNVYLQGGGLKSASNRRFGE